MPRAHRYLLPHRWPGPGLMYYTERAATTRVTGIFRPASLRGSSWCLRACRRLQACSLSGSHRRPEPSCPESSLISWDRWGTSWLVHLPSSNQDVFGSRGPAKIRARSPQRSHTLADPEAPEGGELRRSGGAERVGWVGGAGMIRTDIDLADHSEPRVLKGRE